MKIASVIVLAGLTAGFMLGRACARRDAPAPPTNGAPMPAPQSQAVAAGGPGHQRVSLPRPRMPAPPTAWQAYVLLDPDRHLREESSIAEALLGEWLAPLLRCRRTSTPDTRIELVLDLETTAEAIDAHRVEVGTVEGDVAQEVLDCVRAALPATLHIARGEPSDARPYRGPFTINL